MPLDPPGSLSDPTCHGFTLLDQACAKLTRCDCALSLFGDGGYQAEMQKPTPFREQAFVNRGVPG